MHIPRRNLSSLSLQLLAASALFSCALAQTPTPAPTPAINRAIIPVVRNDWMDTHLGHVKKIKETEPSIFFLGDSITQGWTNSKSGGPVWEKTFKPLNAANFGIGGDRTEHVLWRMQNGLFEGSKPKLVVLMIGTNNMSKNTPEQIAEGIATIVNEIRKLSPATKILLLGIFPREEKPTDSNRAKIDGINRTVSALDDGKYVFYLDIGSKFLQPDGMLTTDISPDFLHLSTKGYQIWAEAIQDKVNILVQEP